MSYQVLARKWRPRTFHELVGQEHVSRALVNALDQGRLHHAYLFTGTRGVGKTTLARILAKCLNCEQGVSSKPCGQCETCRDIDNGRFVDLIEVDAASRTKVEDTRELLDNVQYAPTQGRYKVYLIDEVHMLSTHSFNALLKTLEEPPPHVKFLLATTDPQKLPVTVLSRCLQFTLKNMPPERVVEHLTRVLDAEQVAFDPQALWLLGKAADGSMRDAMSLTDQAIAFGDGEVRREDVAAMLGTLDHAHLISLAQALADVDAERLLAEVASLAEQGPDFAGVLDELSGLMHRLAVAQMVPGALDNGHGDRDELLALAGRFTAEDIQLYYQIALQGRGDIDNAPDTRSALEMTLLRMLAFRPQGVPTPPQTDLPLRGASQPGGGDAETRPGVAGAASAQAEARSGETVSSDDSTTSRTAAPARETATPEQPVAPGTSAVADEPAPSSAAATATSSNGASAPADDRPPWSTESEPVGAEGAVESAELSTSTGPESAALSSAPAADAMASGNVEIPVDASNDRDPNVESGSEVENRLEAASGFEVDSSLETDGGFAHDGGFGNDADLGIDSGIGNDAGLGNDIGFDGDSEDDSRPGADSDAYAWAARADAALEASPAPQVEFEAAAATPGDLNGSAPSVSTVDEQGPGAPADPAIAAEATAPMTHAAWLECFDRLEIGGLTRNLAAHCVIDHDDGQTLHVTLDPGQSAMLSDLHVERIVKALAAVGYTRRLEVRVAELDGSRETAKAKRDREARERHARAVEALRVDPHIQELEAQFGARLIEESVTADRV